MDLSQAQLDTFRREGFLVIERAFSLPEVAVLEAALPEITDPSRAKVGFDKASGMVRLSHGAHLYNEAIRRLSLHPRLVRPAQQLLDTEFHIYQSRLTLKPAAMGAAQPSGWVWHQDFSTWWRYDGMPEPRALVTFTFLDDVTAANAPVLVIPRSHHQGVIGTISENPDEPGDGYRDVEVKPELVHELAQRGGVTALTGPVGTVVFMHCAVVHASGENIAPLRRALFSVVFNPVNNRARHPRPKGEHWISTNVVPVQPLADDCLLTMAN
jgi:ectoine hydroxylase